MRELFPQGDFIEVFVDTPLSICEARDTKGLYRKAREGSIPNFTGVNAPYEAPEAPEIWLGVERSTASSAAEAVLGNLESSNLR